MLDLKKFRSVVILGAPALLLAPLPLPIASPLVSLHAQAFPGRLRRPPALPPDTPPAPANSPQPAAPSPATAPAPAASAVQPPAAPAALPPSMLQDPAKPAQIQFTSGMLSIQADNSSLRAILQLLSSQSGMQIQGLGQDERVFGSFGPGKPHDVLSELLNGTPYNLLMVGDLSNGAPRELILSAASTASAAPPSSAPPHPQPDEQAADEDPAEPPAPQSPPPFIPRPRAASQPDNANPQNVKTPQQLFEELQAMRAQQQQQAPQ
jgi:hypothetical protein